SLSSGKLHNALIGQFRFAVKIGSPGRAALLSLHAANDAWINVRGAMKTGDRATIAVHAKAAASLAAGPPSLLRARHRGQARRPGPDAEIFRGADDLTPSMTWRNLPSLTCAAVRDYYAPLMRTGSTRPMPELA